MSFAETSSAGRVVQGFLPIKVTLASDVAAGDCLGYDSGWTLSASTTGIQPFLITGIGAPSGAVIDAYPMAMVTCVVASGSGGTAGDIVALTDDGLYIVAGSGLPDVGVIANVHADGLAVDVLVMPSGMVKAMDTARS